MSKKKVEKNLCAILTYILIGIVWYFVEKKQQNNFAKFHVKQGIILIIFSVFWGILIGILGFMPVLTNILRLVPLVFIIIGIVNALNNETKKLPIIGGFADKLKF